METPAPIDRPLILGIETSCDDTACAVVDGSGRVLTTIVSSQLAAHQPYGGVVPEIASREHLSNWPAVSRKALEDAGIDWDDLDAIAATRGPGLVGSLLVGFSLGRSIAFARDLPFHAVHHLEGHLYSPFLASPGSGKVADDLPRRFTGLIVSGGHTQLVDIDGDEMKILAETRDDALGEVFDKVGKRLALPYPQGPVVDRLAELGRAKAPPFTLATFSDGSLDFSFSGLKSEALKRIEELESQGVATDLSRHVDGQGAPREVLDLLAGFRKAAVRQILHRLERFHRQRPIQVLAVSGGAAANRLLRQELESWAVARGVTLRLVPLTYAGDNAAMIAHAALVHHQRGRRDEIFGTAAASRVRLGT